MKEIRITLRCLAEPLKHAKIVRVKARLGLTKARELADLLDGTSLAYIHPPGDNSPIGRCCQCQAAVACEVSTVVDGKEALPSCDDAMEEMARVEEGRERLLMAQLKAATKGSA